MVTTPVLAGTPLTFTIMADGSGGEFQFDVGSKTEKRKSRPPRPPVGRRLSSKLNEVHNGNDVADGFRPRTASMSAVDGGPPDSINCVRFACTFTKKNGERVSDLC